LVREIGRGRGVEYHLICCFVQFICAPCVKNHTFVTSKCNGFVSFNLGHPVEEESHGLTKMCGRKWNKLKSLECCH